MKPIIKIKRVYDKPLKADGFRILVDRLWPRGETKEAAAINEWEKDLAPTDALRKWFGHDPELWSQFEQKYKLELNKNEAVIKFLESHENKKIITLIYAAKDIEHNHALVLQQYLEDRYNER